MSADAAFLRQVAEQYVKSIPSHEDGGVVDHVRWIASEFRRIADRLETYEVSFNTALEQICDGIIAKSEDA